MKKIFPIFLVLIIFINSFMPRYAFGAAAPEEPPEMPEWYENEKIKNKKKVVQVPKRPMPKKPVTVGHPALSALLNLALLTPYGAALYDEGMEILEELDMWAYEKVEYYKPLLKEGVLYTGNELKNTLDSFLTDFNNDKNILPYQPTNISYNFKEVRKALNNFVMDYMTSPFINAHRFDSKNNHYMIYTGFTYYYERSNGYKNRYTYFITVYDKDGNFIKQDQGSDLGKRTQEEAYQELKERLSFNDEQALNFFREKMNDEYVFSSPGYKVSLPSGNIIIGDNPHTQEPVSMGITELDGVPYFEYDIENPYFIPSIEPNPLYNPEYLTYYQPVYVPVSEPIPEPIPELIPEYLPSPDPAPEPSPDPSPDPSPEPSPEPSPDPSPEPSPEPSPDPSPEPSPEPIPKPPGQPEFEEGKQCRELDLDLKSVELFTTKFPFSIPWDVFRALEAFFGKMGSEEPKFVLSFISEDTVLELPDIVKEWVPLVRTLILFLFDISVIYALYRWFGGAS